MSTVVLYRQMIFRLIAPQRTARTASSTRVQPRHWISIVVVAPVRVQSFSVLSDSQQIATYIVRRILVIIQHLRARQEIIWKRSRLNARVMPLVGLSQSTSFPTQLKLSKSCALMRYPFSHFDIPYERRYKLCKYVHVICDCPLR